MIWFDLIVLGILLLSAGIGFYQGAIREMVSVLAFVGGVLGTIYGLRFSGPLARHMIHPSWAGTAVAVILVFILIYLGLRLLGSGLTGGVRQITALSILDRTIGLGFGLARAFVFLGICNLVFLAATPDRFMPRWLQGSLFFPMTTAAGSVLKAVAPKGLDMASKLTPSLGRAIAEDPPSRKGDSRHNRGYDAGNRNSIDDLVEKSR